MKVLRADLKIISSLLFMGFFMYSGFLSAQNRTIRGEVLGNEDHDGHSHMIPLAGANIVWLGTLNGVATDVDGQFELALSRELPAEVVVSFIGYQPDTIMIDNSEEFLRIELTTVSQLDEVVVAGRRSGSHYSTLEPVLTNVITETELKRAACCNLSEAFETNASVDVSFSDAITGAQQIQMLGLAGIYSQILTENMPSIRGLGQPFGLGFIPGPWMESIQISKGSASVINGYESITGQINVELKKPQDAETFYYNFYGNNFGRLESTVNAALQIGPRWHTMVMAHGEMFNRQVDHNHDSFLDHPLLKKYNIINRYYYENPGVMESQFGFRVLQEDRQGGQLSFFDTGAADDYGFGIKTNRYEFFAKTGFFFERLPDASIGTQINLTHYDMDSEYGLKNYQGTQNSLYANFLFDNSVFNPNNRITAGLSYLMDQYNEVLNDSLFSRRESVPGIFGQYSYSIAEKLNASAGVRFDFHNIYGTFFTPRFHVRYSPWEKTTVRASAGKGYRVPNMIAENTGLLVSNRRFIVREEILPEQAWNYGLSIMQNFELFNNDASLSAEYFRTDFVNQLIVDVDTDYRSAIFYNLNGKSYANNYQLELSFSPIWQMDILAAFRHTDVKTTIGDMLQVKPFVNKYRGLLTASYATRNNKWQFDATAQFNGKSRLPDTGSLPEELRLPAESPAYINLLAQVTLRWKNLELYAGGENLTNYVQKNPVIASDDPFGEYFDGSMVWGPVMGRVVYTGLRFTVE